MNEKNIAPHQPQPEPTSKGEPECERLTGHDWSMNADGSFTCVRCGLFRAKASQQQALSEKEVLAAIRACSAFGKVSLTYESGPYDIDRPTDIAMNFARAILAAAGERA